MYRQLIHFLTKLIHFLQSSAHKTYFLGTDLHVFAVECACVMMFCTPGSFRAAVVQCGNCPLVINEWAVVNQRPGWSRLRKKRRYAHAAICTCVDQQIGWLVHVRDDGLEIRSFILIIHVNYVQLIASLMYATLLNINIALINTKDLFDEM